MSQDILVSGDSQINHLQAKKLRPYSSELSLDIPVSVASKQDSFHSEILRANESESFQVNLVSVDSTNESLRETFSVETRESEPSQDEIKDSALKSKDGITRNDLASSKDETDIALSEPESSGKETDVNVTTADDVQVFQSRESSLTNMIESSDKKNYVQRVIEDSGPETISLHCGLCTECDFCCKLCHQHYM